MSSRHPPHGCDCAHHRAATDAEPRAGWFAALAPAIACAFCPACLSIYGAVWKAVGLGALVSEGSHHVVLAVAIAVTLVLAARVARQRRAASPLAIAAIGSVLLTVGHADEAVAVEWLGLAVLVVGPIVDRRRWRRRLAAISARAGAAVARLELPRTS